MEHENLHFDNEEDIHMKSILIIKRQMAKEHDLDVLIISQ